MLVLGCDPGGRNNNGVAVFQVNAAGTALAAPPALATRLDGESVVEWFIAQAGAATPDAIGIDTLTEWCTGLSGRRPADAEIRKQTGVWKAVMDPSALQGAIHTSVVRVQTFRWSRLNAPCFLGSAIAARPSASVSARMPFQPRVRAIAAWS